jgi:hypothetical protein
VQSNGGPITCKVKDDQDEFNLAYPVIRITATEFEFEANGQSSDAAARLKFQLNQKRSDCWKVDRKRTDDAIGYIFLKKIAVYRVRQKPLSYVFGFASVRAVDTSDFGKSVL